MDMNTKITRAMNDPNIVKIMNKASKSFTTKLDEDSIHTCHINALWKSFVNYKPEHNTKFTTYLYKGVVIECIKELKFLSKSSKCTEIHNNIPSKQPNYYFDELLEYLDTDEEKSILLERLANCTIQEIAINRGYSRETARKKLKKIYQKIRTNYK